MKNIKLYLGLLSISICTLIVMAVAWHPYWGTTTNTFYMGSTNENWAAYSFTSPGQVYPCSEGQNSTVVGSAMIYRQSATNDWIYGTVWYTLTHPQGFTMMTANFSQTNITYMGYRPCHATWTINNHGYLFCGKYKNSTGHGTFPTFYVLQCDDYFWPSFITIGTQYDGNITY